MANYPQIIPDTPSYLEHCLIGLSLSRGGLIRIPILFLGVVFHYYFRCGIACSEKLRQISFGSKKKWFLLWGIGESGSYESFTL